MVREIEAIVDPLGRCTPANAAKILQMSPQTLANMRSQGRGPPFRKIGGRIFYMYPDLAAYGSGEVAAEVA